MPNPMSLECDQSSPRYWGPCSGYCGDLDSLAALDPPHIFRAVSHQLRFHWTPRQTVSVVGTLGIPRTNILTQEIPSLDIIVDTFRRGGGCR